jgi:glutathione S-transferase
MSPVTVIGSPLSPYVRKVLVVCELKGVDYRLDPIVPFFGDDRFTKANPVRRVPVLIEDGLVLPDSTVICEYLEETRPEPSLMPAGPAARARARWLEEYADTRMGDVLIWKLFNQVSITPYVWGTPRDEDSYRQTLENEVPALMDELEPMLPAQGFLFAGDTGGLTIADIAVAAFFRNAAWAGFTPDPARWPNVAGFATRVLGTAPFRKLEPFEQKVARTPIPHQREALAAMGFPVVEESWTQAQPRKGPLSV